MTSRTLNKSVLVLAIYRGIRVTKYPTDQKRLRVNGEGLNKKMYQ